MIPQTKVLKEIPVEWERLMRLAEQIQFGDISITVKNGRPFMAEKCVQKIKFDNEDDFKAKLQTIPII